MPALTYYELLGVPPEASREDIEAAFQRLAPKYHPDANPGDPAAALLHQQLTAALRVLTNPATRQQYDHRLRSTAVKATSSPSSSSASPNTEHQTPNTPSSTRPSPLAPRPSPRPFRPPASHSPVQNEARPPAAADAGTAVATRPARRAAPLDLAPARRRRTAALVRVRRAVELAKRILWWAISAAVHVLLLWLIAELPYRYQLVERVLPPIAVNLRAEVVPETLEIGAPIPAEQPEDIQIEEARADAAEPDPIALTEAERAATIVAVYDPFAGRTPAGRQRAVGGDGTGGLGRGGAGATTGSESAVEAGLRWLKARQLPTGAWRADRDGARWADPGLTALATLAFLGAGYTQYDGPYRRTAGSALAYLKGRQDTEGCIAVLDDGKRAGGYMYNHGIATLALAEAFAMTKDPLLREATQRAVDFIVQTQNSTGGWRYYANSRDADSSVSGWMVMAMRSARIAGLEVPEKAFDGARKFFASVTDKEAGATSYMEGSPPSSPALLAVGLLCHQYLGLDRTDPYIDRAGILINKFPPEWVDVNDPVGLENLPKTRPGANSYYFWYYANLALHQRRGEAWDEWHPKVRDVLVKTQVKQGTEGGSWPPASTWSRVGGRVYSTAMAILSLEVYYRYAPIYREVVDPVLAAYGRALSAYNAFAGRAARRDAGAAKAREEALAQLGEYLQVSAPKPGEKHDAPTHKRRSKATELVIQIHRHAERYEQTIALLEALPKTFPELVKEPDHTRTLADLHLAYARQLAKDNQPNKARAVEAKALTLYYALVTAEPSRNESIERWLAERFFEAQDWYRAIELYKQRARRLEARHRPDDKNALASAYRRIIACYGSLRNDQPAALWLERLEKLLGPTLTIRRERADLACRLGRFAEARRIHESILAAVPPWGPDCWQAWYDVLRLLLLEGRAEDVVRRVDALQVRRPDLGGPESQRRLLDLRRQAARQTTRDP